MKLAERVHVARRYQRAIRIDTDFGDPAALEGFVCPQSSADVLETMARHALETGQGAFTWTGPYGSGKSSLAVVLGALLNGKRDLQSEAQTIVGKKASSLLLEAFPTRSRGWRVLPVAGRRDRPAQVIGEAIEEAGLLKAHRVSSTWSEKAVLRAVEEIAASHPRAGGGLAVFIDELGKFLEGAARDGTDIHLFQQLAEMASRSGGRLLIIGILHQAFEEYAHRLSRDTRDEWAKIQGRFVDLPINADGNEQIDLLARAIESDCRSESAQVLAEAASGLVQGNTSPELAAMLADCWPLHPVTACLLGPLSRRRFGQNQRSLFGFLNSAEPGGFRDFLSNASESDLYAPDRLWDYLRINLEPSILVSPDGHRWAQAADALGRCEAQGGTELHLRLLKVIALTDLLKERSRLPASPALLELALSEVGTNMIEKALEDVGRWSLVAFRKFADAWTIFEGSDFDIDLAVEEDAREATGTVGEALERLATFRPMVAKRHYHATGALRWFDVRVAPLSSLEETVRAYEPRHGAIGCFLLAIPTEGESAEKAARLCREAAKLGSDWDTVIGLSPSAWGIPGLASELEALERVSEDRSELQGDRVARVEVVARIGAIRERLESELARAYDSTSWYRKGARASRLTRSELNHLASKLADDRFLNAPVLRNELLGRTKPSTNAVAARNALLRRMVLNEGEESLGIEGFPAEGGLYFSLLESTGLHQATKEGWRFVSPDEKDGDPCYLEPLWKVGRELLKANSDHALPVADLYETWKVAPFGVKEGLLPVLAVAFLISECGSLAFYRQGVFQAGLSDLDIDYLVNDARDIQVRWMDLSGISRDLLSELANVVRDLDPENTRRCLDPIDVARGLVTIYDRLPPWVQRTQRLSRNAIRIRQLFKHAKDPNRLIFDDLPRVHSETGDHGDKATAVGVASGLQEALIELRQAYPAMLGRLREILLSELHIASAAPAMMEELRNRAKNIRELGGEHRLEAFIMRVARFEGNDADLEGLAGMAVNKPVHAWVDPDVDKAMVELADMAQRFVRVEAFAHVKGRQDSRHAMAVVVGLAGRPVPLQGEFDVAARERKSVESVVEAVDSAVRHSGEARRNVVLAALAEVSARYLESGEESSVIGPPRMKTQA